MIFNKRFMSLGLASMLALGLMGCGATANEEVADAVEEEQLTYSITICRGSDSDFENALIKGFVDSLGDQLGAENISVTQITPNTISMATATVASAVRSETDLIFTTDKYTLQGAIAATEEVPIIATGVVDFQQTLRIAPNGKSWDKTTGRNVTGVTCRPSIVDQTSLLIEATQDLQTVGILFSSEDTDAIYQNEILEKYLDQAGIPWKEYKIPASQIAIEEEESEEGTIAVAPTKIVAPSAKEGVNNTVVDLGEGTSVITGINSPSSTRTANISRFWVGGKVLPEVETEDSELIDEDGNQLKDDSKGSDEEEEVWEITDESTLQDRILYACSECSVLYIPFGSNLADQMDVIGAVATKNGVVTVGGDTEIAKHCLVTLYSDPYAMGYSAGKKAKKVLVDGSDPATMKITASSADPVKLYNGTIAEAFELSFPKSFSELNEFLESYELGSTTTRVVVEE